MDLAFPEALPQKEQSTITVLQGCCGILVLHSPSRMSMLTALDRLFFLPPFPSMAALSVCSAFLHYMEQDVHYMSAV